MLNEKTHLCAHTHSYFKEVTCLKSSEQMLLSLAYSIKH